MRPAISINSKIAGLIIYKYIHK